MNKVIRALTPVEDKAIGLLRTMEKAIDEGRHTVVLLASREAVEVLARLEVEHGVCKVLNIQWDQQNQLFAVAMTLLEFRKYVDFICSEIGMTVHVDGSVTTFDKLTIEHADIC